MTADGSCFTAEGQGFHGDGGLSLLSSTAAWRPTHSANPNTLMLAYAATIHKSQGSEYPAVVIPVATQHYMMLARNLLYTGVTRGKRLVVIVGQKRALAMAVRAGGKRRWTKLREWLG